MGWEKNIVDRGVDLRQLSIRTFLTKPSPLDGDGGPPKKRPRLQRGDILKRPGTDSGSDSDGGGKRGLGIDIKEKRLKYPVKVRVVLKKFLVYKSLLCGGSGIVRYWEFKAG